MNVRTINHLIITPGCSCRPAAGGTESQLKEPLTMLTIPSLSSCSKVFIILCLTYRAETSE